MFAVISDTHFGDKDCGLVVKNECTNEYELGPLYNKFIEAAIGSYEYLILLGDIFDFAIKDYSKSYEIGSVFFNKLLEKGIVTKGFIYLPGNHDFDLWNLTEYEANVINRLKNNRPVREFRYSVPAIIDARNGDAEFHLYGINPNEIDESKQETNYRYGGLYLDNLIKEKYRYNDEGEKITFSIAYPNLYLFTEHKTTIFNHGHYLDNAWSLFSQYGAQLTKEENPDSETVNLDINNMKDMVSINFPLNQLLSSGVGQSGKFRDIVNQVEHNLKKNKVGKVRLYINNLFKILKGIKIESIYRIFKRPALYFSKKLATDFIIKAISNYQTPRNNEGFLKASKDRLEAFYNISVKELEEMHSSSQEEPQKHLRYNLKQHLLSPKTFIYGHTHVPSPDNKTESIELNNINVDTFNTGGWLYEAKSEGKPEKIWRGARVFFISKAGELSSTLVSLDEDN